MEVKSLGEITPADKLVSDFPFGTGMLPFNVWLMHLNANRVRGLTPVTSLDIYEGATTDFHDEGLFSVPIFGRVGSEERSMRFSYVDMKVEILHPVIWANLATVRALYSEILAGKAYAIWDAEKKDFQKATELDGDTGYSFFMRHYPELEIPRGKSESRNERIEVIEIYRKKGGDRLRYFPVSPAGIRDVQVEDGRVTKDEINDQYYRMVSISNTVVISQVTNNPRVLDSPRYNLQITANAIYDHYESILKGKKGLLLGGFGSRRIFNGTRNVITAMDLSTTDLDSPRTPSPLQTQIGLFETAKGALPVTKYHMRVGWLNDVFAGDTGQAFLVDPKTLKRKLVSISNQEYDRWGTDEGLDRVINSFAKEKNRQKPIMIAGHYIGLIYVDDESYKVFGDIDELPPSFDRKKVYPLSLTLLIYLSCHKRLNELIVHVTRYPVAGLGSVVLSYVYCRTTIVASLKWQLDDAWNLDKSSTPTLEFPSLDYNAPFLDSLVPPTWALAGLEADFDGDTSSANILYGDLSINENIAAFNKTDHWLDISGNFAITPNVATVNLVLHNMTGIRE